VANELAVHAEHAHSVVAAVSDSDVSVSGHETHTLRELQLAVAAANRPEATKKSTIAAVEHAEAVGITLRHHDDVIIGAHASRTAELTHADEAVEVKGRRQHLYAVVAGVRKKHEVVGRYPQLEWILELQRPVASATVTVTGADYPQSRAVRDTELVDGVRATGVVRHQQRAAVAAHRHAVAG
jgi:hypothetical protein